MSTGMAEEVLGYRGLEEEDREVVKADSKGKEVSQVTTDEQIIIQAPFATVNIPPSPSFFKVSHLSSSLLL